MRRRKRERRSHKAGQPRPQRRRLGRTAAALAVLAFLAAALAAGLLLRGLITTGPSGPKTAAIVDQLSLTQPNPDFAASATRLLEQAGYTVDYFAGEQVTVDLYRNLPTHDYDLIILRVHSGIVVQRDAATGQKTKTEYVGLFTGEPYSETKYLQEQVGRLVGRLGAGSYYEGGPRVFSIGPQYVQDSMRGRFDDTLIVMMGCDGLRSQRTAQAFLDKGASAFVSWSQPVSASHTDAATLRLLEKLLLDGLTVGDAVAQTAAEVGPDPFYGAELRVLQAGD
ncbi:MAG: hypothetical protein Q8P22_12755 [Chloroflexota bacterium]|nr:hypothetical protein [Chloroflexota bacterium]